MVNGYPRCAALAEMQRLADDALSREPKTYSSVQHSSGDQACADGRDKRHADGDEGNEVAAEGQAVSKLLACWRGEVLKLLLQRAAAVEATADEARKAARQVVDAREACARAETEVKVRMHADRF